MDKDLVLKNAQIFAKEKLKGIESGHGWWHAWRVRNLALNLAQKEGGDCFIIEMASLLHDVDDWKFVSSQQANAREWLREQISDSDVVSRILEIIATLSYKGAGVATPMKTLEGQIVQDADRLDAMGAIGIARTFSYGGHTNREIYEPDLEPKEHKSFEEYRNDKSHCINHFYEKLLLLKGRMNTLTAKELAISRHDFMGKFLEEFFKEWEGKQ